MSGELLKEAPGFQAREDVDRVTGTLEIELENGSVVAHHLGDIFQVRMLKRSGPSGLEDVVEVLHCPVPGTDGFIQVRRGTIADHWLLEGNHITFLVPLSAVVGKDNKPIPSLEKSKPPARTISQHLEWISPATADDAQALGFWPTGAKLVPTLTGTLELEVRGLRWFYFEEERLLRIEDIWSGHIPEVRRKEAAELCARVLLGEEGDIWPEAPAAEDWAPVDPPHGARDRAVLDDENAGPDEDIPF